MPIRSALCMLLICLISPLGILPIGAQNDEVITIYSGRSEDLIAPILDRFTEETGIQVEVLYGSTAALAGQILEEGDASPADVFISQDGGALGALANEGMLAELPEEIIGLVPEHFSSSENLWVGLSGRARVLVYNPEALDALALDLPESIFDLAGEEWKGQVGWAPTNASFQTNVTAMRLEIGDEAAQEWLEAMVNNDVQAYAKNTPIVEAVIVGEIPVGLVNHYYLFRFLEEDPDIPARLHYFPGGDVGSLVNTAGAAALATSDRPEMAFALIEFLLGLEAQQYFADSTYEYPMIEGVQINELLLPLSEIESPMIDVTDLADLEGTLELIEESGALD